MFHKRKCVKFTFFFLQKKLSALLSHSHIQFISSFLWDYNIFCCCCNEYYVLLFFDVHCRSIELRPRLNSSISRSFGRRRNKYNKKKIEKNHSSIKCNESDRIRTEGRRVDWILSVCLTEHKLFLSHVMCFKSCVSLKIV